MSDAVHVPFPDGDVPLEELHYDPEHGLHKRTDCGDVPCRPDAAAHAAAVTQLMHHEDRARTHDDVAQLSNVELIEDMLGNLREMARRVRQRHYLHYSGRPVTHLERDALVIDAMSVRVLADVILPFYPAQGDPEDDHRVRRPRYPWQDEAEKRAAVRRRLDVNTEHTEHLGPIVRGKTTIVYHDPKVSPCPEDRPCWHSPAAAPGE